jgi:DTW domain-containing protein YfiP
VLILQHRRERFHPFNTARIVHQSLERCRLLVDHTRELARQFAAIALSKHVGLLYPGNEAPLLAELPPSERPDQLVVLDGTWHHAKSLLRDIPDLQTLPRYRLAPTSPGRYRIRREPNEHALSTLEATVAALSALEPETLGLDRLSRAFDQMIDGQIRRSKSNWRQNRRRRRGASNVPRCLLGELSNIVVAYAEHQRGGSRTHGRSCKNAAPIYWVAERLESGETFRCAIESAPIHDDEFLARLRLSAEEFYHAVPLDTFRERWKAFLRPHDRVAVYHPSTARLLNNIEADFVPWLILKSINFDPEGGRGTLDQFLRLRGIETQPSSDSRASERLANAIALIQYLNSPIVADHSVDRSARG